LKRVNRLLEDVLRHPTEGIGKPESLRHAMEGCWSRRIDEEHRLVYVVESDDVVILQARFHYRTWRRSSTGRRNFSSSRADGDRTHDRGIMRWPQTVGMVRWRRI